MKTKNKKGSFEWETIAKFLIALVILVILIVLANLFKEKLYDAFEAFKRIL